MSLKRSIRATTLILNHLLQVNTHISTSFRENYNTSLQYTKSEKKENGINKGWVKVLLVNLVRSDIFSVLFQITIFRSIYDITALITCLATRLIICFNHAEIMGIILNTLYEVPNFFQISTFNCKINSRSSVIAKCVVNQNYNCASTGISDVLKGTPSPRLS